MKWCRAKGGDVGAHGHWVKAVFVNSKLASRCGIGRGGDRRFDPRPRRWVLSPPEHIRISTITNGIPRDAYQKGGIIVLFPMQEKLPKVATVTDPRGRPRVERRALNPLVISISLHIIHPLPQPLPSLLLLLLSFSLSRFFIRYLSAFALAIMIHKKLNSSSNRRTPQSPLQQLKDCWREFYSSHHKELARRWDLVTNLELVSRNATREATGGARTDTILSSLADATSCLHAAQASAYLEWVAALQTAGLIEVEWTDRSAEDDKQIRMLLGSAPFQDDVDVPTTSSATTYSSNNLYYPNGEHTNNNNKSTAPSPSNSVSSISSTSSYQEPWIFVNPASLGHPQEVSLLHSSSNTSNKKP
jgi:hypothetical protein